MNRIFKTIWNKLRGQVVVVNETTGTAQARGASRNRNGFTCSSEMKVPVRPIVAAMATAFILLPAASMADVRLYGWDHYTTVPDGGWKTDLTAANYGNDSSTLDLSSSYTFDNMAFGRRSGSHIYGPSVSASGEGVHNGWVAGSPTSYLTAGGNLNIHAGGDVTVRHNFWLFGCEFVDRTTNDHDGHDDVGAFGQDIYMDGGRLSIGETLDVGHYNKGNPNGHCVYYEDWNQVFLHSGAELKAGDIEGVAKFTIDGGSTLTTSGDLGSIRAHYDAADRSEYYVDGSTINVAYLNSNAKVFATNGTLIVAPNIDLTTKTYSSTNSTLNTTLDQITDYHNSIEHTKAIKLSDESIATLNASALGRYDNLSKLLDEFVNNVTWSGGKFDFNGTYTQAIADKATSLIQNQWGSGVDVEFEKVIATPEPIDYSNGLTAAMVNSIVDENSLTDGAVFIEHKLDALKSSTSVGGVSGQNNIVTSAGFIGINGTQTTTVTGGKTLVLLGTGSGSEIASGKVLADNGTLRLGTTNTGVTIGGVVNDVDLANKGILSSYRGTYTVADVSGNGSVDHESGTITYQNLNIDGDLTNLGTMTLGDGASWGGGSNKGRLNTQSISVANTFSNSGGTWYLDGVIGFEGNGSIANGTGTIYSKFGNFFDNGTGAEINPLNTVTLAAAAPEKVRVIETELFTQYIKGTVKEDILEHMTFDGKGVLHVTDATLTTTQRDDLTNAFKEAFGSSTQLVFDGKIEGTSENSVLNVAKVNQLQNAGFKGVVYFDRELEGENGAVSVGSSGIKDSVGFMGINDAKDTIGVTDGKELVLVGKKGTDGDSYAMTDGQAINVSKGTLTVGSLGLEGSADYSGSLAGVTAAGSTSKVRVVAGDYKADSMILNSGASFSNDAKMTISGKLEGTGNAVITNNSALTVDNGISAIGTVTNNGTLTVSNGISANGYVTNAKGATLNVTGDTNITGGSLTNSGNATLNGNLNVAGGSLTNNSFLETNTMSIAGSLVNYGTLEASDDSEVYGTLTNTGTIDLYDTVVGQRGEINNTHSITGKGTITVNGLLTNVSDADFTGEILVLTNKVAGTQAVTYADTVATVQNLATMDFDEATVGNGTEFWNSGTFIADEMTVEEGGYYFNGAMPSADGIMLMAPQPRATTAQRSKTVAGSETNTGDAYYGTLTIAGTGTYTNGVGGVLNAGESTYWADGTGTTIEKGGVLANGGTAILASSLNNAGEIRGDGTVTLKRGATGTNEFRNTGTINISGTLQTDGVINYIQTAGSLKAANNSFTNSTFTIEGGSFDIASVGTGNTYNFGKAGADASVNVQADVGTVTSDNTYNIYEGSTFNGRDLQLTKNEKTVHLLGGTLETTLDQMFDDIDYTAIDIDADSPDDLVDVEGVKVATGVGDVFESVEQGIEFGWGTVAFDDAVYSASVASDVLQKLDDIDVNTAGHEHQLEVAFNGKASQSFTVDLANQVKARPHGTDQEFGSAYAVFAGETLTNTTTAGAGNTALYVGRKDTQGLSGTNILDNSIGFKAVEGATGGMTVADGRHFVFVGELKSAQDAANFEMIDGKLTVKTDGLVTLGSYGTAEETTGKLLDVALEDGTLQVRHGSFTANALTGGNGSHLYIGGDGKEHGGETLRADTTSAFGVASYEAGDGSEVLNWGTVTVDAMTTAAAATTGGSIANYGTLDVGTATIATAITNYGTAEFDALTLNGQTITNAADAEFTATTFKLGQNGKVSNAGTWESDSGTIDGEYVNEKTAEFGSLSITANGDFDNDGTATADSLAMAGGLLDNDGTFTLNATAASSIAGTIDNAGTFDILAGTGTVTLANGGKFTNTGKFDAKRDVSIAGGTFQQSSDTAAQFTNLGISGSTGGLVVDEGKTAQGSGNLTVAMSNNAEGVKNAGTVHFANTTITSGKVTGEGSMTADGKYTVAAGGSVDQTKVAADTFENAGTVSLDELELTTGTNTGTLTLADSMTGGDLTNSGTLNLAGTNGFGFTGKITNAAGGKLNATEKVTVDTGADLALNQGATGNASFEAGLDVVNQGHVSVAGNTTATGSKLTVTADAADTTSVENNGTIAFDEVALNKGTISGTGTIDTDKLGILAAGSVLQGTIEAGTLTNAGLIDTDNLTVETSGTNTGVITATNADLAGFTNETDGEMTLEDSLAGALVNEGTVTIKGGNEGFTLKGSLTNQGQGSLTAEEAVTVAGGHLIQNSSKEATFTDVTVNSGDMQVAKGSVASGEDLTVNAAEGVKNEGSLNFNNATVSGTGSVTGTGALNVAGKTDVAAKGSITQNAITTDTLVNAGTVTTEDLTVETSGQNTGTLTATTADVTGLTNESAGTATIKDSLAGDLTNEGTLTLGAAGEDDGVTLTGVLTNQGAGALTAVEDVTIDAADAILSQSSSVAAQFKDVTVNKGKLSVAEGSVANGEDLTVNTAEGVTNDGTLGFNNATVADGASVTGTGSLDIAGKTDVAGKGSITQDAITTDTLENAGTITAGDLTVETSGTNTGVITATNANLAGFTNETDGEMTLEDSLAGALVNEGTVTIKGGNEGFTLTGSLTNQGKGSLAAEEAVTVAGGHLIQNSTTEATFKDVTVNKGKLSVAEGSVANGEDLTVNAEEGLKNDGTVNFGNATVSAGASVTGTGTLGDGTGTLTVAEKGSVAQGLVDVDTLTNSGTIAADVEAVKGTNAGTINAGDFTITASGDDRFTNTGSITTTGNASISNVTNEKDMTFGNGASMTGDNSITGTTTVNGGKLNVAGGETTVSGSGKLDVNVGTDITGTLTASGSDALIDIAGGASVTGSGVLKNDGSKLTGDTITVAGGGELVSTGADAVTMIGKLTGQEGGKITVGGGSFTVDDLTDAEGVTFTQTATTEYDIKKGWFENSTLNFNGGHFDASVIHDDEGNASGMLGQNTVNINGSPALSFEEGFDEKPSAEKVNWSDKYVTVKVDTVNADTIINIGSGGVLDVDNIDLTTGAHAGDQTITVGANGAIQTSLDQFFDHVATTVIDINAVDPETGKVDIITDVIATTTVTDVKDEIASGIGFENGGMVVWDDEDWSVQLVTSVLDSLASAGMISEDVQVEQHFLGDFMGDFTIDTATALKEEQEKLENSWVLDPGVVFDTTTLHNNSVAAGDANKGLVIGGTAQTGENQIDYSIGFKDVANADYIRVEGGKEFVLVGGARPDDFDWTTDYDDSNKLLTDAADGGSLDIQDGTITLGSNGLEGPTAGWVNSAELGKDGSLGTKNGEFAVWDIKNEGTVTVTDGSILHANDLDNEFGSTQIAGDFTADRVQNNNGKIEIAETGTAQVGEMTSTTIDAVIDNAGKLVIDTVTNNVLAGTVSNVEKGELTVKDDFAFTGTLTNDGTAHYEDVTVSLGGWTNNGYEEGGVLDVAEEGRWTNNGTAIWDQMTVAGEAFNTSLEENEGLKVGTDAEGDAFTITGKGSFTNTGRLDATEADMTNVAGDLANMGLAGYNDMTITAGGSSFNEGYEQGHKLVVSKDATHTNTGTSIWDEVLIEKGGKDVIGSDSLGETLFQITSNYDNFGEIDATKAEGVTVTGTLTNEEGATSAWDDLTIAGWKDSDENVHEALVTNDGTETGDHLTIAAGGTHVVTGESSWNSITVDAGGTDRYGSDEADESFMIGGKYVNNGTLDATKAEDMIFTGSATNNGVAGYQDLTVKTGAESINTGYEKGEDLTVDGIHANTGTSIWNTASVEEGGSMTNGEALAEDAPKGNEEGFKSESVEIIGTDAADEVFNVAGDFINHGIVDLSKTETTEVSGSVTNDGQAKYDDMTIVTGGESVNDGLEIGDILTVAGDHVNTGTSIWNNASVAEGGSMTNGEELGDGPKGNEEGFTSDKVEIIGSDAADEVFDVAGDYVNHGITDLTKTETTHVAGTGSVTNDGQAQYDDMTIEKGGESVNDGLEIGDILTVAGDHVNTGTSIWNNASVAEGGSMTNGEELGDGPKGDEEGFTSDKVEIIGSDKTDDVFDVAGDYVNHGVVDASKSEDTNVSGSVTNDGVAKYDDMTIDLGGKSDNSGYEQGDILTVDNGKHTNTGTSIWNNVTIGENGSATNGEELAPDAPKGDEEGFESDSTTVIGTADDPNNKFDIDKGGSYDNHGKLDASETEDTNVNGDLHNDGQAWYDDMNIGPDGSSKNDGYEQGDILTVEGEHENTGTSIWNNVTIGEGGTGTNGEELAPDAPKGHEEGFESDDNVVIGSADNPDDEFNIDKGGSYNNHGKLDASETEDTNVDGDLHNDGQAWYDDMNIGSEGSSKNDGYEKGDILEVEGDHENTGTSIWNNVHVAEGGSDTNKGDLDVGGGEGEDDFVVDGDFTNEGNLDATDSENTDVNGDLVNNGHAEYDDMDINDGGKSENNEYEKGDILDVNDGGEWDQNGESHWNNVNIGEGGKGDNSGDLTVDDTLDIGGDFNNTGDIDAGKVVVEGDGVLDLGDGSVTADETVVNGGDIVIGNKQPIDPDNRVDYDTSLSGSVNGHFWVIGNGDLSFGSGADKFADETGAPDIGTGNVKDRITVTEKVTIGEKGSIAVGSDTWTDKDNHKDVGDGNLYFGSDSLTVIDSTLIGSGEAAFEGTSSTAKVTVEDGAQLVLGNLENAGDYLITSGFQTAGNVGEDGSWLGGWNGTGAIWAPTDEGSGLEWTFDINWDDTKIWVHAQLESVINKYPDIAIPDNIDESLENCKSAGGADQVLACTVIRNPDLSAEEKTRIMNSVAEIGYAAGAMSMALNEAQMAADSLEGRLSMRGEAFTHEGAMKSGEKGTGLWVDVLSSWTLADSYEATGNMSGGYDADSYGFIMGADHKLEGKNVILGAAMSYTDGSLDSKGDWLDTKNDFNTFGIHGYAAWKPTEKTNIVGTISYMRSSSEAEMSLPAAAGFSKAKADIDTNMFVMGVRGEALWNVQKFAFIPHAGLRMIVADFGSYDTKLDGQKAYSNDADVTTTFQMPIGITARADMQTQSGWTIRPTVDLTLTPQFGDVEQETTVKGTGGATDNVTGDFTGHFAGTATLGIQAESQNGTTVGLRFGYTAGGDGKADKALRLEIRKLF